MWARCFVSGVRGKKEFFGVLTARHTTPKIFTLPSHSDPAGCPWRLCTGSECFKKLRNRQPAHSFGNTGAAAAQGKRNPQPSQKVGGFMFPKRISVVARCLAIYRNQREWLPANFHGRFLSGSVAWRHIGGAERKPCGCPAALVLEVFSDRPVLGHLGAFRPGAETLRATGRAGMRRKGGR